MPAPTRIFAALAFVCALAVPGYAGAQASATIVLSAAFITHSDIATRGQLLTPYINYADCLQDDVMSFPVVLSGAFAGDTLEVWAGSGCDQVTNRTDATSRTCWLVAREPATAATLEVPLHVRDILAGIGTGSGVPPGTLVTGTGSAVCEQPSSFGSFARAINLSFLLVADPTADQAVALVTWKASCKLLGPPPPTNLHVSGEEARLDVAFDPTPSNADPSENGFNVYCLPPPGAPASPAPEDAGLQGQCADSINFHIVNAPLGPYLCGNAPKGAAQISADGLSNGDSYSVAVAALDTYFNVGPVSSIACGTPVHSLSETSIKGCGPCSFSSRAAARAPFTLAALLGLMFLARRRRSPTHASAAR